MQPTNVLFIMADEHQRNSIGCYGNPHAHTPNLDRLAAQGTRFTNAYTPSPICVPARAAMATGRPVHQTGHWDNAFPYDGEPNGWAHQLTAQGHTVDSIGKLHYRRAEDPNGFGNTIDAMYVAEGIGEVVSCLRERAPHRKGRNGLLAAGPGESPYLNYDRRIVEQAEEWIDQHAAEPRPWVLFVSLVNPHPPFIAPPESFSRFDPQSLPLPNQWHPDSWPQHPAYTYFRRYFGWEEPLAEDELRRLLATYYAQVEFVDRLIGRLLERLETNNLTQSTRILYTSDHGAMLGARGLFGKFSLYDESASVPMILAGPDVPVGKVVETPVSLLDCGPTCIESVTAQAGNAGGGGMDAGASVEAGNDTTRAESLIRLAQQPVPYRTVLSEYHAAGSRHAAFMLRDSRFKYMHYVNQPAQLFDLQSDPAELNNLAQDAEHASTLQQMENALREMLNPEAVDTQAKADQKAKVDSFGGETAVLKRGLSNSPIPGEAPIFHRNLQAHPGN